LGKGIVNGGIPQVGIAGLTALIEFAVIVFEGESFGGIET
jgi:hypothetical protein